MNQVKKTAFFILAGGLALRFPCPQTWAAPTESNEGHAGHPGTGSEGSSNESVTPTTHEGTSVQGTQESISHGSSEGTTGSEANHEVQSDHGGAEGGSEAMTNGGRSGSSTGEGEGSEGGLNQTADAKALSFSLTRLDELFGLDEVSSPAASVHFQSPLLRPLEQEFNGQIDVWVAHVEDANLFTKYNFSLGTVDLSTLNALNGKSGSDFDKTWVSGELKIWKATISHLKSVVNDLTGDAKASVLDAISIGDAQVAKLQDVQKTL